MSDFVERIHRVLLALQSGEELRIRPAHRFDVPELPPVVGSNVELTIIKDGGGKFAYHSSVILSRFVFEAERAEGMFLALALERLLQEVRAKAEWGRSGGGHDGQRCE